MAYRLILAYDGTSFAGWQRQSNALAVQQVVEEALSRLTGEAVRIVGAGRTDAGVHAAGQVASFTLPRPLPLEALLFGVNARLPAAVRVLAAGHGPPGFHALRRAVAKDYRYRLEPCWVQHPLGARRALRVDPDLDWEAMRRAASALVGRHDFAAFALAGGTHRSSQRRIFSARWVHGDGQVELRIVGDGFLRGMVRSLVGTLLEVGLGRRSLDSFTALLGGGGRHRAGPTAPPQGLTLHRVWYRRCDQPEATVDRPRRARVGPSDAIR